MLPENLYALPLEQQIVQFLFIGLPGTEFDAEARALVEEVQPGGVIIFGRNVAGPEQLRSLLERKTTVETTFAESVHRLKSELDRAVTVADSELPNDLIAIGSTVELEDLSNLELVTYTLVLPEHADFEEGRISILAPIGMALLGYRVGDEIEWPVPGGMARMRICKHLGRERLPATAILAMT